MRFVAPGGDSRTRRSSAWRGRLGRGPMLPNAECVTQAGRRRHDWCHDGELRQLRAAWLLRRVRAPRIQAPPAWAGSGLRTGRCFRQAPCCERSRGHRDKDAGAVYRRGPRVTLIRPLCRGAPATAAGRLRLAAQRATVNGPETWLDRRRGRRPVMSQVKDAWCARLHHDRKPDGT